MVSASGAAIFTVVARDAASAVMGKIGKSMGSLRGAAGEAFKSIVAGAAAVTAAFIGIAAASVKAAMEDQKAQARMIATLKARGLATEENLKAIDATILASQKYGQTDDDVRKSIETATQYTKSFTAATKISAVATQLAAAKGMSLEEATSIVGKAYAGNGKALKQLGIDLKRTGTITEQIVKVDKKGVEHIKEKTKQYTYYIKGQAALNEVLKQYGGIADAVAATPAAKLEAAQIRINEAFESFGYTFLPAVADAIDWLTTNILPGLEAVLGGVADFITSASEALSKPGGFLESVGKVASDIYQNLKPSLEAVGSALGPLVQAVLDLAAALWGDGEGPLAIAVKAIGAAFKILLDILKPVLDILTAIINAITTVVKGLNDLGSKPGSIAPYVPNYGGSGGSSGYGPAGMGGVSVQNTITFGNDAISYIDTKLGAKAGYLTTYSRVNP